MRRPGEARLHYIPSVTDNYREIVRLRNIVTALEAKLSESEDAARAPQEEGAAGRRRRSAPPQDEDKDKDEDAQPPQERAPAGQGRDSDEDSAAGRPLQYYSEAGASASTTTRHQLPVSYGSTEDHPADRGLAYVVRIHMCGNAELVDRAA